jgi:hypothetical protein
MAPAAKPAVDQGHSAMLSHKRGATRLWREYAYPRFDPLSSLATSADPPAGSWQAIGLFPGAKRIRTAGPTSEPQLRRTVQAGINATADNERVRARNRTSRQ